MAGRGYLVIKNATLMKGNTVTLTYSGNTYRMCLYEGECGNMTHPSGNQLHLNWAADNYINYVFANETYHRELVD